MTDAERELLATLARVVLNRMEKDMADVSGLQAALGEMSTTLDLAVTRIGEMQGQLATLTQGLAEAQAANAMPDQGTVDAMTAQVNDALNRLRSALG